MSSVHGYGQRLKRHGLFRKLGPPGVSLQPSLDRQVPHSNAARSGRPRSLLLTWYRELGREIVTQMSIVQDLCWTSSPRLERPGGRKEGGMYDLGANKNLSIAVPLAYVGPTLSLRPPEAILLTTDPNLLF